MLDLPKSLILSWFRCDRCEDIFAVSQEDVDVLVCPRIYYEVIEGETKAKLCAGKAWAVEDVEVVTKNRRGEAQPKWHRD
jgi:hypothetical protein